MKLIPLEKINKILIARPEMIGDTILLTPLISEIKAKMPQTEITLLLLPQTEELIKNNKEVGSYILVNKKRGIRDFFKLIKIIKNKKFDLSIVLEDNPTPHLAFTCFFAGIPYRIGDKNRLLYGWTYNYGVWLNSAEPALHQVELHGKLLDPLGITKIACPYKIVADLECDKKIEAIIKEYPKPLIGLHIGTGGGDKSLLPETYAQISNQLNETTNCTICLLGGEHELPTFKKMKGLVKNPFLNLVNRLSLSELFSMIKNLDLFIGVNSGPLHIAAAFKVPTVAIYVAKDISMSRWLPWMTKYAVIKSESGCTLKCSHRECILDYCQKRIVPEIIIKEAKRLLNESCT